MNFLGLDSKTIVVTGGSSGIGEAIVEVLLENEGTVIVLDKSVKDSTNENLKYIQVDITKADEVTKSIQDIEDEYGKIDVLINNAGVNSPRLLVDLYSDESNYEIDENSIDFMFGVNIKGLIFTTQSVVKSMLKNNVHGTIINVTSEAGLEGSVGQSIYSATKGATNSLTRSWGKELGPKGIKVVGIAPGINEETGLTTPEYNEALAYTRNVSVDSLGTGYEKSIPLGRVGKLRELGYLAAFLSSDKSDYITGTTINITGGKSRG